MFPQTQTLTSHLPPSLHHSIHLPKTVLLLPSLCKSVNGTQFTTLKTNPCPRFSNRSLRCSVSVISEPICSETVTTNNGKPNPAEICRTIMELSSVATLSTLNPDDNWPLGTGVRFSVDPEGTPVLSLNDFTSKFSIDRKSSIHVQLEQCGMRTPQCTILGTLKKPQDTTALEKLHSVWEKRHGNDVNIDSLCVLSVERVLHIEDFAEDGKWVTSLDYKLASPDPLRDFAERMISEINTQNMEDVLRFCNIYVDVDFQVCDAKILWVDRLGFDVRFRSPQKDAFEVRIPFPREVTDEKGAKSSFNCMSQLAWETEKNFHTSEFNKVKQLKKI